MKLKEILQAKGTEVHTIGPEATLDDVVQDFVRYNVGSLIVCDPTSGTNESKVIGIATERGMLRAYAERGVPLAQLRVSDIMTTELLTASPDDEIEHAMQLMTHKHVRHLPIMADHKLCGIVSIGDVVKAHDDALTKDNFYMQSYIQGEGAEVGTPAPQE